MKQDDVDAYTDVSADVSGLYPCTPLEECIVSLYRRVLRLDIILHIAQCVRR